MPTPSNTSAPASPQDAAPAPPRRPTVGEAVAAISAALPTIPLAPFPDLGQDQELSSWVQPIVLDIVELARLTLSAAAPPAELPEDVVKAVGILWPVLSERGKAWRTTWAQEELERLKQVEARAREARERARKEEEERVKAQLFLDSFYEPVDLPASPVVVKEEPSMEGSTGEFSDDGGREIVSPPPTPNVLANLHYRFVIPAASTAGLRE